MVDEAPYLDIAEQLAIPCDTVRKRIQLARTILRESLAPYLREEDGVYAALPRAPRCSQRKRSRAR
jgi:hypothetical protein